MKEENEFALAEAKRNPQAYACLGLTIFSGFLGLFFGFFLTDLALRVTIAGIFFVLFIVGILGHGYFTRREAAGGLVPSRTFRLLLGIGFGLPVLGAIISAAYALGTRNYLSAVLLIVFAAAITPFALKLFPADEERG